MVRSFCSAGCQVQLVMDSLDVEILRKRREPHAHPNTSSAKILLQIFAMVLVTPQNKKVGVFAYSLVFVPLLFASPLGLEAGVQGIP